MHDVGMLHLENKIPTPLILLIRLAVMFIISRSDHARILRVDRLAATSWAAVFLTCLGFCRYGAESISRC